MFKSFVIRTCMKLSFVFLCVQVKDVMKDVMAGLQQTNSEKILLSWVRQNTRQYPQVGSELYTHIISECETKRLETLS